MNQDAVQAKLKAKFGNAVARTGGKGSVRRKKKVAHKKTSQDDKKLQSTLKKLNVNNIPAIEEVNIFKDDGTVVHFNTPTVQAALPANTYVISGDYETKRLEDLLPGIINQLGADSLDSLRKMAPLYDASKPGGDSDDEVPDLVESFEDAAVKPAKIEDDMPELEDNKDDDMPELVPNA